MSMSFHVDEGLDVCKFDESNPGVLSFTFASFCGSGNYRSVHERGTVYLHAKGAEGFRAFAKAILAALPAEPVSIWDSGVLDIGEDGWAVANAKNARLIVAEERSKPKHGIAGPARYELTDALRLELDISEWEAMGLLEEIEPSEPSAEDLACDAAESKRERREER
jgi:hypothetical protein